MIRTVNRGIEIKRDGAINNFSHFAAFSAQTLQRFCNQHINIGRLLLVCLIGCRLDLHNFSKYLISDVSPHSGALIFYQFISLPLPNCIWNLSRQGTNYITRCITAINNDRTLNVWTLIFTRFFLYFIKCFWELNCARRTMFLCTGSLSWVQPPGSIKSTGWMQ